MGEVRLKTSIVGINTVCIGDCGLEDLGFKYMRTNAGVVEKIYRNA